MTTDDFFAKDLNPHTEIPRDGYGRPKVIPLDGGKLVPYTRVTTLAGAIEDTYNLGLWQQRMVAKGMALRADLRLGAAAAKIEDKKALDEIADKAKDAAQASSKATIGTALHSFTEAVDRGEGLDDLPPEYAADLAAYVKATAEMKHLLIEQFVVCDELKAAGTPDRVSTFRGYGLIADVKTGNIEWGMGKIAMQLAIYAHSKAYDPATGERSELSPRLKQTSGIVIHLPAGAGTCELHWVDLAAGWDAVQLAVDVRKWRSRKGLSRPVV